MVSRTPFQQFIYDISTRVFNNLGPGHNEQIYQKALLYEFMCNNINVDLERHIDVIYIDSKGNQHRLVSERIDIFIHMDKESIFEDIRTKNVILELKAISKTLNYVEIVQINKYFKELDKENTSIEYGILINFPQPSGKGVGDTIDFKIVYKNEELNSAKESNQIRELTLDL